MGKDGLTASVRSFKLNVSKTSYALHLWSIDTKIIMWAFRLTSNENTQTFFRGFWSMLEKKKNIFFFLNIYSCADKIF